MDSPWASRRRMYLRVGIAGTLALVIGIVLFNMWYEPPTCFDGKKNQDEVGADCGGSCSLMCASMIQPRRALWTKAFEVSPNIWSVAAYVQHTNFNAYTDSTSYKFTFYDVDGKLIGERTGHTFMGGEPALVIVESKIDVGERAIYRTIFEWLEEPTWYKKNPIQDVVVEEREIVDLPFGVEVRAWLHNDRPTPVEDVEVALVVYDDEQTAIAVSSTYVEYVGPRDSRPISFAWPRKFSAKPTRLEFIARVKQPN